MHKPDAETGVRPVRMGIVGITGFAQHVADMVLAQVDTGSPLHLVAITAPDADQHPSRLAELQRRGVELLDSFDQMLASGHIDAVWLPLPIALHLPFTEQALAAGKAVMCEKPITATVEDCDQMIAARDCSNLPVGVGFGMICDPSSQQIKQQIRQGVLGWIQHVAISGCWPRGKAYYTRSSWAGRIQENGRWVLDSPLQNAMSHFVNLALYWLGPDGAACMPRDVAAELYRVNPIESFDTCCVRYTLDHQDQPTMLVCMTHACQQQTNVTIDIHGDRGRLHWTDKKGAAFFTGDERTQVIPRGDQAGNTVRRFAALVRGQADPEAPVATLEMARAHLVASNGANEATSIADVPSEVIKKMTLNGGDQRLVIPGIEDIFRQCVDRGAMLHETGLVPWAVKPGQLDLQGYDRFDGRQVLSANSPSDAVKADRSG